MLDLNKLESKLNEALAKETSESLNDFMAGSVSSFIKENKLHLKNARSCIQNAISHNEYDSIILSKILNQITECIDGYTNMCHPPNLTYCKAEIYPEFDCNTCKWNDNNSVPTK